MNSKGENNNMSWVVWITGLPGSGKSTVSEALKEKVPEAEIIGMDELRKIVTPEPVYSDFERECVYRALVYSAKALNKLGHNVIIDATGNRRTWRELARAQIPVFLEVYLKCPLEICMQREISRIDRHAAPEGIYEKGKKGWPVPGVNIAYEAPEKPELIIDTDINSPEDAVKMIVEMIKVNTNIS
jgi:adenylylsulfate kinase